MNWPIQMNKLNALQCVALSFYFLSTNSSIFSFFHLRRNVCGSVCVSVKHCMRRYAETQMLHVYRPHIATEPNESYFATMLIWILRQRMCNRRTDRMTIIFIIGNFRYRQWTKGSLSLIIQNAMKKCQMATFLKVFF